MTLCSAYRSVPGIRSAVTIFSWSQSRSLGNFSFPPHLLGSIIGFSVLGLIGLGRNTSWHILLQVYVNIIQGWGSEGVPQRRESRGLRRGCPSKTSRFSRIKGCHLKLQGYPQRMKLQIWLYTESFFYILSSLQFESCSFISNPNSIQFKTVCNAEDSNSFKLSWSLILYG